MGFDRFSNSSAFPKYQRKEDLEEPEVKTASGTHSFGKEAPSDGYPGYIRREDPVKETPVSEEPFDSWGDEGKEGGFLSVDNELDVLDAEEEDTFKTAFEPTDNMPGEDIDTPFDNVEYSDIEMPTGVPAPETAFDNLEAGDNKSAGEYLDNEFVQNASIAPQEDNGNYFNAGDDFNFGTPVNQQIKNNVPQGPADYSTEKEFQLPAQPEENLSADAIISAVKRSDPQAYKEVINKMKSEWLAELKKNIDDSIKDIVDANKAWEKSVIGKIKEINALPKQVKAKKIAELKKKRQEGKEKEEKVKKSAKKKAEKELKQKIADNLKNLYFNTVKMPTVKESLTNKNEHNSMKKTLAQTILEAGMGNSKIDASMLTGDELNLAVDAHKSANKGKGKIIIDGGKGASFDKDVIEDFIFNKTDFSGTDLSGKFIHNVYFVDCNFKGANLSNAKINTVLFTAKDSAGISLQEANLSDAKLFQVTFQKADLSNGNWSGSKLKYVGFDAGCQMFKMNFTDSTFALDGEEKTVRIHATIPRRGSNWSGVIQAPISSGEFYQASSDAKQASPIKKEAPTPKTEEPKPTDTEVKTTKVDIVEEPEAPKEKEDLSKLSKEEILDKAFRDIYGTYAPVMEKPRYDFTKRNFEQLEKPFMSTVLEQIKAETEELRKSILERGKKATKKPAKKDTKKLDKKADKKKKKKNESFLEATKDKKDAHKKKADKKLKKLVDASGFKF